jgi:hypothetical protein
MRFQRLIQFVATSSATPSMRVRLGDVMSGRVQPQSTAEECAVQDFTHLSLLDLNEAWVTQSSAQLYSKAPSKWDPEQHLLRHDALTSSEEGARSNARLLWNRHLQRTIGCRTFLSTPTLSVTAFVLPAGTQLDLHDHPGMTVLQALLVGNLSALSLDWVDALPSAGHGANGSHSGAEGVVVHSGLLKEGARQVILPTEGGVLHHLSNPAVECSHSEVTVFVDFITPPYFSPPECAHCTYYKVAATSGSPTIDPQSFARLTRGDRVWLAPDHAFSGPAMEAIIPVQL